MWNSPGAKARALLIKIQWLIASLALHFLKRLDLILMRYGRRVFNNDFLVIDFSGVPLAPFYIFIPVQYSDQDKAFIDTGQLDRGAACV